MSVLFSVKKRIKKREQIKTASAGGNGQLHLIHPIYLYLAHVPFDGPTIFLTYSLTCIAINRDCCNLEKRYFFRASVVETQAILSHLMVIKARQNCTE